MPEPSVPFLLAAVPTVGGALGVLLARSTVHCVLCLIAAFTGIAVLYLQLDAQFLGLAQVVVYIGAIAILVLFAVLLTGDPGPGRSRFLPVRRSAAGLAASLAACAALWTAVAWTPGGAAAASPEPPDLPVGKIGEMLLGEYVIPLEAIALLLTAALIGAALVASGEPPDRDDP